MSSNNEKAKKYKSRRLSLIHPLRSLIPMRTHTANLYTKAVRIRGFLSRKEIRDVLTTVKQLDHPMYTNNPIDDINKRGEAVHVTSYLNTDDSFETRLAWLAQRIKRAIALVNTREKWGFQLHSERANIRVAEYHEMYPEGSLSGMDHCDTGSLVTLDLMLQPGEGGGQFQTVDNCKRIITHSFEQGDALVFVSHKHHRVTPLREGVRKVLVVEVWAGVKRRCGHRCDVPQGACCFVDNGAEDEGGHSS